MLLYGGAISLDPADAAHAALAASDFGADDYWTNNFNDVLSGYVTLFELLVVNNWFVLVDGFGLVDGGRTWRARGYFTLHYVIGVQVGGSGRRPSSLLPESIRMNTRRRGARRHLSSIQSDDALRSPRRPGEGDDPPKERVFIIETTHARRAHTASRSFLMDVCICTRTLIDFRNGCVMYVYKYLYVYKYVSLYVHVR